jgi:hypothetical protein
MKILFFFLLGSFIGWITMKVFERHFKIQNQILEKEISARRKFLKRRRETWKEVHSRFEKQIAQVFRQIEVNTFRHKSDYLLDQIVNGQKFEIRKSKFNDQIGFIFVDSDADLNFRSWPLKDGKIEWDDRDCPPKETMERLAKMEAWD